MKNRHCPVLGLHRSHQWSGPHGGIRFCTGSAIPDGAQQCPRCRSMLVASSFPMNWLGKQSQMCRRCTERQASYRATKRDVRAMQIRSWRESASGKALTRTYRSSIRWGLKEVARRALRQAVRKGKLVKPNTCQDCHTVVPRTCLHGHHHDYSRPLDVRWLCASCHARVALAARPAPEKK